MVLYRRVLPLISCLSLTAFLWIFSALLSSIALDGIDIQQATVKRVCMGVCVLYQILLVVFLCEHVYGYVFVHMLPTCVR